MTPSPVPPPSKQPRCSGRIRKAVNKDIVSADKNAPSQQRNVVNQLPTQKPSKQQAKIAKKSWDNATKKSRRLTMAWRSKIRNTVSGGLKDKQGLDQSRKNKTGHWPSRPCSMSNWCNGRKVSLTRILSLRYTTEWLRVANWGQASLVDVIMKRLQTSMNHRIKSPLIGIITTLNKQQNALTTGANEAQCCRVLHKSLRYWGPIATLLLCVYRYIL